MNLISPKGKEAESRLPEFTRPVDPDNDFNQTLGPYKYLDGSTYFG
jgi:hypothetical protein